MDPRTSRCSLEATIEGSLARESRPLSHPIGDAQQILAVSALREPFPKTDELIPIDPPGIERDLLGASDPEALAFFQGSYELRRLDEAVRRAGVEPGIAPAKLGDAQQASLDLIKSTGKINVRIADEAERRRMQEVMAPRAREAYLERAGAEGKKLLDLYQQEAKRLGL